MEYLRDEPEVSRITGMRRQPLSRWAVLTVVIPAVGLVVVAAGILRGRGHARLLGEGLTAMGRLVDEKRTNARMRNRRVYRLRHEFKSQTGVSGQVVTRTNMPEHFVGREALLFYDPENVNRAVLLDSLPGQISADGTGQPVTGKPPTWLLLPMLIVLANAWYAYALWAHGQ